MWIDYAIYLTTGLVMVSAVGLIVVVIRNRANVATQVLLVGLLVAGLIATTLVRPERFRGVGVELVVAEVEGELQTEVELIGLCLSIFRRVGPLSFIAGNDLFPGETWERGPVNGCDASGHSGPIRLPDSVRSGDWMLCDYSSCHTLTNQT